MKLTVFTPTYNRGYIIENLYRSLQRQTCHDFEWLVVDDGSSDNTQELFRAWQQEENPFPIRYVYQENGGKHRAINRGLDLAEGELFFTVDSDDYLTDDAVEKVIGWFKDLDPAGAVQGIVANRGYAPDATSNYLFEEEFLDRSLLEIYTFTRDGVQVFDGERAFIFYTDFHRKYMYPEFVGENFMTEAVTWNRMAHDSFKMRFYNDIIWVFEYREDGLTKAGSLVFLNNPRGYGLWLREKSHFGGESWIERLKMYYTFTCDLSNRLHPREIAECIGAHYLLIVIINTIHKMFRYMRKMF